MSTYRLLLASAVSILAILATAISGDLMRGSGSALVIGIGLYVVGGVVGWQRKAIRLPAFSAVLLGVLLVIISFLSIWKVGFTRQAIFGSGLEWGTLASIVLFSTCYLLGSVISQRVVPYILWGVELTGLIGAAVVALILSGLVPVEIFASSWMQLAVIFAGSTLTAAVRADLAESTVQYAIHSTLAVASLIAFIALFSLAVAAITVACALASTYFLRRRTFSFPYVSGALALLLFAALLFGMRTPSISLPHNQRPSLYTTMLVSGPVYMSSPLSALIGSGPHTYPYVWNAYRPAEVNATPQWMLSPRYSYSTLSTIAVEYGMLGIMAFIFIIFFPLAYLYKENLLISGSFAPISQVTTLLFLLLLLSLCIVVEQVGVPLLCVMAILGGMCVQSGKVLEPGIMLRFAIAVSVVLLGAGLIWVSAHQVLAQRYDARGFELLSENKPSEALPVLIRAADLWGASEYFDGVAAAYLGLGLSELKAGSFHDAQDHLQMASAVAGVATSQDPENFSRWLFSASLNIILISRGAPGSAEKAVEALDAAERLSPTRPEVFFERARMAIAQKHPAEAIIQLDKALLLKPDYTDALTLRAKLTSAP